MMSVKERGPFIALGVMSAVIFSWFLPEIRLASLVYNDGVNHVAIIRMMDEVWSRGGNILDFWLPHINFGHAFLRSYQFLMHLLIWLAHKTVFSGLELVTCFNACITIFAMALPWTFFAGARWLGLTTFEATASAIAAALVHESLGYGIGLTNATFSGYGTYNQLAATVFFPLAVGLAHRFLRDGKNLVWATLAFSATVMSHIMTGYFAALWILIDAVLFLIRDRSRWRRLAAALLKFGGLCLLWTGAWVIPMAQDTLLQHHSLVEPQSKWLGFGAASMLTQFASSDILDGGRLPILTLLAGIGLVICLRSRKRLAALALAWLALSFGPATWGPLFDLLPFSRQIHWHRAFAITQIALMFCVGVAVASICRWIVPLRTGSKSKPPKANTWAAVALCAALLFPCLLERQNYFYAVNTHWLEDTLEWWTKKFTNYPQALDFALKHSEGRYNVGHPWTWGAQSLVTSYIPFYALLTQFNVENIGAIHHHQSHTEVLAFKADWKNTEHNTLMNVRYVGLKPDVMPPPEYSPIIRMANSVLYDNGNHSGYFGVGTLAAGGCAGNDSLAQAVTAFLKSPLLTRHVYPEVRLARDCVDAPDGLLETALAKAEQQPAPGIPGRILESGKQASPNSDLHWAKVKMDQPGLLLFKMNFHPGWIASVNGKKVSTRMVVPAFVGIPLEAGESEVRLWYDPGWLKRVLLWISVLGFFAVLIGSFFRGNKNVGLRIN